MENQRPLLNRYVIPDMPSADQLLPYLRQIDGNRWYTNFGPLVAEFENRLIRHLSTSADLALHGPISMTALMTCYHALQIGLQLFRLPPQATVLVPAVTFPACPLAIQHAGGSPTFVDVEPGTWQLTPQAARRIAEKMPVHAVMPVAVYGVPVSAEEWDRFNEETGIPVIIDAAAAFETQAIPARCLLAHSFHATKPFGAGEGGILVSRDAGLIEEARVISNFGTRMRISEQDGSNAKMSEYHAAVGLAQFDRWGEVKKRRHRVFAMYSDALDKSNLDLTLQQGVEKIVVSALMMKSLDVPAGNIIDLLNGHGVAAHRMYLPPLYRHSYFSRSPVVNAEGKALPGDAPLEQKAALMTVSEQMQASIFGIPFHAFLEEEDIAHVMQLLTRAMNMPQGSAAIA